MYREGSLAAYILVMSRPGDISSGLHSSTSVPLGLHRPFEDVVDITQRQRHEIQRSSLLRHQFPGSFVNVAGACPPAQPLQDALQQPGSATSVRQLTAEDRVLVPVRSVTSAAGEQLTAATGGDDDDDDETADSATFNVSSNVTTHSNGQQSVVNLKLT